MALDEKYKCHRKSPGDHEFIVCTKFHRKSGWYFSVWDQNGGSANRLTGIIPGAMLPLEYMFTLFLKNSSVSVCLNSFNTTLRM